MHMLIQGKHTRVTYMEHHNKQMISQLPQQHHCIQPPLRMINRGQGASSQHHLHILIIHLPTSIPGVRSKELYEKEVIKTKITTL